MKPGSQPFKNRKNCCCTSAEWRTLVTLACADNSASNFIPLMFIFPRLKYSEMFNPGKTMTIYDITGLVKESLLVALNPTNIMSGFKASGIRLLNADIFEASDLFVTDRPNPAEQSENDKKIYS